MHLTRRLVGALVPLGIALCAFLNARAVSELISGSIAPSDLQPSIAQAHAAGARTKPEGKSADAIIDRNPFDHATGSLRPREAIADNGEGPSTDPWAAPECEGLRSTIVVGTHDPEGSLAAFDVSGKRVLGRPGDEIAGMRVRYVGRDRVWLDRSGGLCQARLFAQPGDAPPAAATTAAGTGGAPPSAFERFVSDKIVKVGPTEYQIERSAVDRILEAQAELMKARVVPDKEGDRVVGIKVYGIKPRSVLALLGIQDGDRLETINGLELSSPEHMLETYSRLRTGAADRMSLHLSRGGKAMNLDYAIR